MTEAEWLSCTDPTPMLEFLVGKASDRKLRLFAVASFARIHRQPIDRVVIELGERYADGSASEMQRQQAWETIDTAKWEAVDSHDFEQAAHLWARQRPVVRAMTLKSGIIGLAALTTYPSWPTLLKKRAAPTLTSCATCENRGSMCGAAGPWT